MRKFFFPKSIKSIHIGQKVIHLSTWCSQNNVSRKKISFLKVLMIQEVAKVISSMSWCMHPSYPKSITKFKHFIVLYVDYVILQFWIPIEYLSFPLVTVQEFVDFWFHEIERFQKRQNIVNTSKVIMVRMRNKYIFKLNFTIMVFNELC